MDSILVTGSDGLVGHAIKVVSENYKDCKFIFCTRKDADLTCQTDVENLYKKYNPTHVIHTAARVGGIGANLAYPAEFFYQNILMNSFIIHYAHVYGVKKLLCFSSVCSFPDNLPVLEEQYQQDGQPYKANASYGYSKRMVDVQINAYRSQYGVKYSTIIPGNIFGPADNYSLDNGHVVPSLIHKCFIAKQFNTPLHVWGDGKPLREFIYSIDLANITLKLLFGDSDFDKVLVSNNTELSIREIVDMICKCIDFKGEVVYDTNKPSGQYRRPSNISKLKGLIGDLNFTDHQAAMKNSVEWFVGNYFSARK